MIESLFIFPSSQIDWYKPKLWLICIEFQSTISNNNFFILNRYNSFCRKKMRIAIKYLLICFITYFQIGPEFHLINIICLHNSFELIMDIKTYLMKINILDIMSNLSCLITNIIGTFVFLAQSSRSVISLMGLPNMISLNKDWMLLLMSPL